MITYREARKEEWNKVAELAAASFGEYPMFDLVFRDRFRTLKSYLRFTRRLQKVNIRAVAGRYTCLVGEEDGEIVSAALLERPGTGRDGLGDYLRAGGLGLVWPVGMKRLGHFFGLSEEARSDCAKSYPQSWYLELLVVDGSRKGKGLGSRMLSDCVKPYVRAHGGETLTLITNTERNCAFYRKNGFQDFAHRFLRWKDRAVDNWSFVQVL